MKTLLITLAALFASWLVFLGIGTPANKEYVEARAIERLEKAGFKVVGYEGYQWGGTITPTRGGARCWYLIERDGILYNCWLQRWSNEPLQIYEIKTVDKVNVKVR